MNFIFSWLNGGDTKQTYLRNELLDIMVKLDILWVDFIVIGQHIFFV
jgi:hypothetical protein